MEHFIMIGCGGVGFALLELINKKKLFNSCKFLIIEPRDIPNLEELNISYHHLKTYLTKENYKNILDAFMGKFIRIF